MGRGQSIDSNIEGEDTELKHVESIQLAQQLNWL